MFINIQFLLWIMESIDVKTTRKEEIIDITDKVIEVITNSKVKDGICVVYTPHTSAGIVINENSDPDVKHDLLLGFQDIVKGLSFRHAEGNSDAHIKSALIGKSHTLILKDYKPVLGTYDGIFFCEFDGPRSRNVFIEIIKK